MRQWGRKVEELNRRPRTRDIWLLACLVASFDALGADVLLLLPQSSAIEQATLRGRKAEKRKEVDSGN